MGRQILVLPWDPPFGWKGCGWWAAAVRAAMASSSRQWGCTECLAYFARQRARELSIRQALALTPRAR